MEKIISVFSTSTHYGVYPGIGMKWKVEISSTCGLVKLSAACSLRDSILGLKVGIELSEKIFQFLSTKRETVFGN